MPFRAVARYTARTFRSSPSMAAILPILIFVVVVAIGNRLEFGSFD